MTFINLGMSRYVNAYYTPANFGTRYGDITPDIFYAATQYRVRFTHRAGVPKPSYNNILDGI
jgi:hypothetical protein